MILLQIGYAGMNIITKLSLNSGMSHYVLVVYRHAFAAVVMAPFALFFERNNRPFLTLRIFAQCFALGLLGPVIDQNFYYMGLKYTSPTFSSALSNILPAMTFVMALVCRMENVHVRRVRLLDIAKVVGTLITVGGALLMTLYKGNVIDMTWMSSHVHPIITEGAATQAAANKDWVKGSILLILATLAWAGFFILQAITMRAYPAHLSLTAIVCSLGTLQSIVVTLVMEHRRSVWTVGWDINLLAAAYAGIISSGLAYYLQGTVMEVRGPVFVTAFSPLMMIIVAFMDAFILADKIYVGGAVGAALIVIGLYSVLWGKYRERKEEEARKRMLQGELNAAPVEDQPDPGVEAIVQVQVHAIATPTDDQPQPGEEASACTNDHRDEASTQTGDQPDLREAASDAVRAITTSEISEEVC